MMSTTQSNSAVGLFIAIACLQTAGGGSAIAGVIHVHEGESIQTAISAASAGDEIIVHPGTYDECIDFLGKAVWLHSADGPDATFIDADGLQASVVSCVNGEGPDTILQGFTITGGQGTDVDGHRRGGGIYSNLSSPMVIDCHFLGNSAQAGGGMGAWHGDPVVIACSFKYNSAAHGAGASVQHGAPQFINTIFTGNSADGGGGGMFVAWAQPRLINCLFLDNQHTGANGGAGGLYIASDSAPELYNCTLTLNTSTENFDAIFLHPNNSVPAIIANSIMWDNGLNVPFGGGGPFEVTYSAHEQLLPGEGNICEPPVLVDPDEGDCHLSVGSPCIDAGDNTAVPPDEFDLDGDGVTDERIPHDLDGQLRFVDDPDTPDSGNGSPPVVDMGACEFPDPCRADLTDDGTVDMDDVFNVLSFWGHAGVPADINQDGTVDIDDIFAILGNWGPCP